MCVYVKSFRLLTRKNVSEFLVGINLRWYIIKHILNRVICQISKFISLVKMIFTSALRPRWISLPSGNKFGYLTSPYLISVYYYIPLCYHIFGYCRVISRVITRRQKYQLTDWLITSEYMWYLRRSKYHWNVVVFYASSVINA